jgi:hypothetical protein
MPGAALARPAGFIARRRVSLALKARNHGSAMAGRRLNHSDEEAEKFLPLSKGARNRHSRGWRGDTHSIKGSRSGVTSAKFVVDTL